MAIEYFFVNIYGSPDDIDSIVTPIMKTLRIPQGSYTRVKGILQDLKAQIGNGKFVKKTSNQRMVI